MTRPLRTLTFAALISLAFAVPGFAQDAMAPAAGAMMAGDAMAPMSDDDLKLCLEQAAMITFPHVMDVATAACHDTHNGMMPGAMAPAMAPDAMAPATK